MHHSTREGPDGLPPGRGFCVAAGRGMALGAIGGEALATATQTQGRLSVLVSHFPPGHHVPPHVHQRTDECFYVLTGSYTITCGPDTFHATAGSVVFLPRGTPHSHTADEKVPAGAVIFSMPGGLERFEAGVGAGADPDLLGRYHDVTFLR